MIGGLGLAIAATGVAAASGVFSTPEQLAGNAVGCYEHADLENSDVSVLSPGQDTPIETCRRELGIEGPLVACAGRGRARVPRRPGTCERLGYEPLPAEYTTARARVLELQRELAASRRRPTASRSSEFAARAQRVLDRLGWTGWRVEVRDDLGNGPCGSALGYGGDGSRSIEGSARPSEHQLIVMPGPRRSTLDLLDRHGVRLMDASGERCYERRRRRAARPRPAAGRQAAR